ncbi:MAG: AbrB/MazE/SpoVT family DNA-binding domain-containing protein [Candidatus Woesearchaeota archaeon]
MRRNIIKQGKNSYTMTMPISWIRDNNIDGGSEVLVEEEDNNIIISTINKAPLETSIIVNLKKFSERSIKNIIFQLYRKGYDKITCTFQNLIQRDIIKKIVKNNLLGFEVIIEKNDKVVIENIAEPSKEKFISLLNKLFFIIKTDARDIISELEKNNFSNQENHKDNKNIFDVYTNFLRRIVIKEKLGGSKDSYLLFYFISQLSYIQHSFFYSYNYCLKNKIKIDSYSLKKLNELLELINTLYESFVSKDIDKSHLIGERYIIMNEEIMAQIDKQSVKNKSILSHILIGLRFIHLASTVIFGLSDSKKI